MAMSSVCLLLLASSSLLLSTLPVAAKNTMEQLESFRDNSNSTTSILSSGNFTLHFSSIPNNTANRYLVISYVGNSFSRVVWVANRDTPITNHTGGVLNISAQGNLTLYQDSASKPIWSSSNTGSSSVRARLLNTGNLVVEEVASKRPVWQSFDHPTNTFLPGMKIGKDPKTGHEWNLTSWKSEDDPSTGEFSYLVHRGINGAYEMHIVDNYNGDIRYRSGRWNTRRFSGNPNLGSEVVESLNYTFFSNESGEAYYSFKLVNSQKYVTSWFVVGWNSVAKREAVNRAGGLETLWTSGDAPCDKYRYCGKNQLCANDACTCFEGFEERRTDKVCSRKKELTCAGDQVRFERVPQVKIPDTSNATVDPGRNLGDCAAECRKNCTCVAYAMAHNWDAGSSCFQWYGDLWDARKYNDVPGGQDSIYLKVAADSSNQTNTDEQKKRNVTAISTTIPLVMALVVAILGALVWSKRRNNKSTRKGKKMSDLIDNNKIWDSELQCFDLATIASMTNNFANMNKIGEGGFGSVYKGRIRNGQEVAVKRLSDVSRQGIDEFMNEVVLIGKLQHRNLVRLLGCCITREERIIVYEYMSNKSLDTFIFGKTNREMLHWRKRVDIITGIARGLLYLHEDSRFRIIHRDLKAGNILLDEEMNPRISDFGTARLFKGDQLKESTRTGRVIGTYGYMSPEYAMDGIYSVKSDAFSFGVLVLEIISGMKNRALYEERQDLNLLALAWRLWKEDRALELLDGVLTSSCSVAQVLRHIQIALLCVQEFADDRPTMSMVAFMLSNGSSPLPQPRRPGFCKTRSTAGLQSERESTYTINEITLTNVGGR